MAAWTFGSVGGKSKPWLEEWLKGNKQNEREEAIPGIRTVVRGGRAQVVDSLIGLLKWLRHNKRTTNTITRPHEDKQDRYNLQIDSPL
jgi:hypothetical protein